jgi:hypothetical protein
MALEDKSMEYMLMAIALVGMIVLTSLNPFFKIGWKLIGEYSSPRQAT